MKRIFKYTIGVVILLAFATCTKEETPIFQEEARVLSITITDGGYASATSADPNTAPATRAVENGYITEFTEGDACGLFVVRGGNMIYSNVKLTAGKDTETGGLVWKPEDGTMFFGGLSDEHYYLYYPYKADLDNTTISNMLSSGEDFYKPLVDVWQLRDDQSTYAAYTASDLMTAEGSATTGAGNTLHLSFSMTHRMALAVIEMPKTVYKFTDARVPDYMLLTALTFSGTAKPLRMADGSYRHVVKPNATSSPTLDGSYDGGSKEFTVTPSGIAAGSYKRYKVEGATETLKSDYTIQRGDYLLTDGNLLPKETVLTEEQKASVAAIVFWTPAETTPAGRMNPASLTDDKIMAKDYPNCTHGLAVSVKDISTVMAWQNPFESVKDFQNGTGFNPADKADYVSIGVSDSKIKGDFHRVLGYQNTKVLLAYNDYCKAISGKEAYVVKPVDALASFTNTNPAPAHSTGWFIPSVKELHMLCYKDVDDIKHQYGSETRGIVETSLSTVGGEALVSDDYWSSSEDVNDESRAYHVSLQNAFVSVVITKDYYNMRVRAVCAF